jgi:ABC-type polysaccharide/polyol phosphate export permease
VKHLVATVRKRRLVFELARNDFRARYTGSLMGTGWAFAQPILTILMYLFVYRVAFRGSPSLDGVPFVTWMIVGITPWFFFSEAVATSTTAFTEYSYLVKKIPFDIAIVPSIKVVSSALIHSIVWLIVVGIVFVSGIAPHLAWLQVVYYFVALFALVSGIGLFSSSITPFFRDTSHVVAVALQFLFWLTPIGWSIENAPAGFGNVLQYNPMFYIVEGMRDALLHDLPFWHRPLLLGTFWATVLVLHLVSYGLFRRLRPHIADVL